MWLHSRCFVACFIYSLENRKTIIFSSRILDMGCITLVSFHMAYILNAFFIIIIIYSDLVTTDYSMGSLNFLLVTRFSIRCTLQFQVKCWLFWFIDWFRYLVSYSNAFNSNPLMAIRCIYSQFIRIREYRLCRQSARFPNIELFKHNSTWMTPPHSSWYQIAAALSPVAKCAITISCSLARSHNVSSVF